MNFMYPNKLKSFTLLELLITIAVSSVIIICCVHIFYGTCFVNLNQRKNYSKLEQINYAMSYMENEIADSVEQKVKYGDKYEIRRISKDILNSTYYGNNLLIKDIDYFDVENIEDYLVLKISFNGREYSKYVFLKNKKFEYLTGEN